MPFTVYILYAADIDKYYLGYTSTEIKERLRRHLSDHKGFTSRSKQWEIVYTEIFEIKSEALRRESEIKGWKSRKKIEQILRKV